MYIFKTAYRIKRKNSDSIYKGFVFRHLSDATQYYIHPKNELIPPKTTLCQPIGEALSLLSSMIVEINKGNTEKIGDIYFSDDNRIFFANINIQDDWRENGVVQYNIYNYKAFFDMETIRIAAYDMNNEYIRGDMEHLHPLYKLLPCIAVIIAKESRFNEDYSKLFNEYIKSPSVDLFANLHEDIYQNHKNYDYNVIYEDISDYDISRLKSYSSINKIVQDNKEDNIIRLPEKVIKFNVDEFSEQYRNLIPKLSDEFILPWKLKSVCNAVTEGDTLAVLLHGPSGTGKTISCKLICQETGIPIMDTINCTENLDEYILGKYIPEDDKIVFKESFVTKAVREGGAVIFEEINFAKPQYLAFLNSLLDDNGFVRLDNGEIVKRHKNFRFFATMNIGYYGTRELNQALYNRFNNIIEIGELSDKSIRRMLISRVPQCEPMVEKIISVFNKIKRKIENEELDMVISPRNLENWAKLAKYEGYVSAAEKTIIPIAKCDRIFEETIRSIIVLYKWKEE
ncbi:AAA family ATPase [Clostridium neonatale]|uniref:AAA family ATPase n=1 Tax=Clostridium neonatale TaxID=137838 RepID=UPI00291C1CF2|nr:AAA family ATPase [Clostridium neonatale]CAI3720987.1 Conserved hypothetical protein, ATPase domain [Clostridium neonatale]